MTNVKKSLVLSFVSKYAQLGIAFISSIIIARLLTPEEVGLFSMVAGVVVIAHMLRDFGVSSYIVKEKNFDDEKCSAAFFVTAGLSWSAGIILFVCAPFLMEFFHRQEVLGIARLISLNFFIIPFGSISLGLLRKKMNFHALLIINVSSSFINALTTIVLAYNEYSYMSLVWASIAGTIVTVVLGTYYREKISFVIPSFSVTKKVFSFGGQVSLAKILNSTIEALPDILVGKYIGVSTVGLMSRAKGLTRLFHQGVTQAVLPVLLPDLVNKRNTGAGEAQKRYLEALSYMCSLGWPFFILLTFISDSLILILFGENWIKASEFVIWFSAIAAIKLMFNLSDDLMVALDKTSELLKSRLIINIISLIVLVASIQYGLTKFLIALVGVQFVGMSISLFFLVKYCHISIKYLLISLALPFTLALILLVALFITNYFVEAWQLNPFFDIVFNSLIVFVIWIGTVFLTNTKLKIELKVFLQKIFRD